MLVFLKHMRVDSSLGQRHTSRIAFVNCATGRLPCRLPGLPSKPLKKTSQIEVMATWIAAHRRQDWY